MDGNGSFLALSAGYQLIVLLNQRADGTASVERLTEGPNVQVPHAFTARAGADGTVAGAIRRPVLANDCLSASRRDEPGSADSCGPPKLHVKAEAVPYRRT